MERCASLAFGVTVLPAFGPLNGAVKEQPEESKSSPGAAASAQQAMPGGFGSAKQIIFLQLRGGMSHIDSFDPKEGKSKGPKGALATKAGFQVSEFLPKIAKVAEEICVIRSMTAKVGVREDSCSRLCGLLVFDPAKQLHCALKNAHSLKLVGEV